jgi:hypothetical protein
MIPAARLGGLHLSKSLFRSPGPVEALFGFWKRGIATDAYRGKTVREIPANAHNCIDEKGLTERPVLYPRRSPKAKGSFEDLQMLSVFEVCLRP